MPRWREIKAVVRSARTLTDACYWRLRLPDVATRVSILGIRA